ncbi:hypothetical protein D9Q98_005655 [Chlorella vulgaris]|uniref:TraB domain-containing protein n=1 Tax=Chlorella vulgaris TaxID=3077 RepID=A0A9D4TMH5_CHLVU|nr:hypothetical protein D9Q98_005655 [Chlorella vulgaris]
MPTSYVQLQPPEGGAAIHLFGVVHGGHESEVGEFILRQRPELVVVETALNAAHGSAHGNTVCRQDCLTFTHSTAPGSTDHRARTFAHYGVQLADMPHPLGSHLWNDLSQGSHSLYNEQLVYVAAFAVGAELVFGDRPKEVTYSRMLWLPSIVDLDHAFANMSASNYKDLVQPRAPAPPAPEPSETMTPVLGSRAEAALLGERDAILLSAVHKASLQCGSRASIVCVVGASHVAGMEQLWKSGRWRGMVAGQALLQAPSGPRRPETAEDAGVRRALLEGVIRLTCRTDVQQDVQRVLGAVPAESREAYSLAHELYGNARMLLAVLNREQLQDVCLGWRCEMWDLLAPVRAARPVNGGSGIDRELVLELRTLNFEIG